MRLSQDIAANDAPAGEPEVWDAEVPAFNPLFGHEPKPAPVQVSSSFNVEEYLAGERAKDLLRFSTAGSVDDGKSTLIGRLLYDTQSVYEDQVRSIAGKGTTAPGVLDLALLTDGLRAEREQGITIDVAYRYFATARRKFIIADTPGHEQYTRNMATGASTADAAIVLVDARKGVLKQSRRHAAITALLGVPQIVVAVNKMDLVGWKEHVFRSVQREFTAFFNELELRTPTLHFVPVSALAGDNIVHPSTVMPWYAGPTLLELLESLPSSAYRDAAAPFRFAVQRVVRPNLDFRGFAGQIAAGTVRPGASVIALPSGRTSRVARIVTFDGDLPEATAPLSVMLTLEDEIDISRGDLLASPDSSAQIASRFDASMVWMNEQPLDHARRYLLKVGSRTVQAFVPRLRETLDLSGEGTAPDTMLALNGIGLVQVETLQPLAVDLYEENRHTGNFILIDGDTNATVAAGMIRAFPQSQGMAWQDAPVTPEERAALWGHTGAYLEISDEPAFANALERALLTRGAFVVRSENREAALLGALVIASTSVSAEPSLTVHTQDSVYREALPTVRADALARALALLRKTKVLTREARV